MKNYYKHEWVKKVFETKNFINEIEDNPGKQNLKYHLF